MKYDTAPLTPRIKTFSPEYDLLLNGSACVSIKDWEAPVSRNILTGLYTLDVSLFKSATEPSNINGLKAFMVKDLVKFSNELRSFERFYYIKIRWSFNRVVAQSNQMLKTRRNSAGVSVKTNLKTIPVLTRTGMQKTTKIMNRAAYFQNICSINVNNSQPQQNRNNQFVPSLLLTNVMRLPPKWTK